MEPCLVSMRLHGDVAIGASGKGSGISDILRCYQQLDFKLLIIAETKMLPISKLLLPYFHSSVLFATTLILSRRRSVHPLSSISFSTDSTVHYWVTTSLFRCGVVSELFALLVGNDIRFDVAVRKQVRVQGQLRLG
jgi:hypothetical protein